MGFTEWVAIHYSDFVRFGAIYDLISTGIFALPILVDFQFAAIIWLHNTLNLSGEVPQHPDGFHFLFATLMGSINLVWALYRIVLPLPRFGLADGIIEIFYCFNMYYYATTKNLSQVIHILLFLEVHWCVAHIVGFVIWKRENHQKFFKYK